MSPDEAVVANLVFIFANLLFYHLYFAIDFVTWLVSLLCCLSLLLLYINSNAVPENFKTIASDALGVAVAVERVQLKPLSARVSLRNIDVSNAQGFRAISVAQVRDIEAQLDWRSFWLPRMPLWLRALVVAEDAVAAARPIRVEQLRIKWPTIIFDDIASVGNNIATFMSALDERDAADAASSRDGSANDNKNDDDDDDERALLLRQHQDPLIYVECVLITHAVVQLHSVVGHGATLALPSLRLAAVGGDAARGDTKARVIRHIVRALLAHAAAHVAADGRAAFGAAAVAGAADGGGAPLVRAYRRVPNVGRILSRPGAALAPDLAPPLSVADSARRIADGAVAMSRALAGGGGGHRRRRGGGDSTSRQSSSSSFDETSDVIVTKKTKKGAAAAATTAAATTTTPPHRVGTPSSTSATPRAAAVDSVAADSGSGGGGGGGAVDARTGAAASDASPTLNGSPARRTRKVSAAAAAGADDDKAYFGTEAYRRIADAVQVVAQKNAPVPGVQSAPQLPTADLSSNEVARLVDAVTESKRTTPPLAAAVAPSVKKSMRGSKRAGASSASASAASTSDQSTPPSLSGSQRVRSRRPAALSRR